MDARVQRERRASSFKRFSDAASSLWRPHLL